METEQINVESERRQKLFEALTRTDITNLSVEEMLNHASVLSLYRIMLTLDGKQEPLISAVNNRLDLIYKEAKRPDRQREFQERGYNLAYS